MTYHHGGERLPQNRNRPASTGRPELPNLAAWEITDTREQRKLQLYGESLLRETVAHHRKRRREETNSLGKAFRRGGAL